MADLNKKICFISSCGGHLMQLIKLLPVAEDAKFYIISEKNTISKKLFNQRKYKHYFLLQQDRKKTLFFFVVLINLFASLIYFIKERPDVVITTGAGVVFPTCILAKLFSSKLIYVESFARIYSASKTGKQIYKFADYFYVQWEEMLSVYPNAIYEGSIH